MAIEADLVRKIRDNPRSTRLWTEWYRSVYPKLYYAAFRLARGRAELAKDLTQESFTRFLNYQAIDRVNDDRHALAFLIRTCKNLAIDRGERVQNVSLQDIADIELHAALERPEPEIDLDRMLQTLQPQDRQFMQWVRDGLSVAEIAQRSGLTYTATGVRLYRIRKNLQESFGTT